MALTKVTQHVLKDGIISSSHLASGFTLSASHISSLDTDNLSEGSSNLYFTNERVDDRVNALLTAGTGITLTYDDANNTLTVSGSASYGDSDVASYLSNNGYDTAANIKADLVDSAPSTLNTLNELAAALGDDANFASSTSTALGLRVERTSATGSAKIPVGTTGQRDGSPSNGFFRYNTTTSQFEGYSSGSWGEIGGGSTESFITDQFNGDDSTTAFALTKAPSSEDKLMVFIDGVYQQKGDYTLSGSTLTLDTAPLAGEVVTVHTIFATVLDATGLVVDTFTATSGQTVFTLSTNPKLEANTQVFKEGVYLDKSLYSVSGNTLTLNSGATTGDKVDVLILSAAQLGTASLVTDSFTGNGSTSAYTLSDSPNSVMVFLDGAFQAPSTYTLSNASLTFGANVPSGVVITVYHVSGSDFSGVNSGLNSFTGNGSTTAYTLTQNPGHENNTMVYLNGVYQEKDTYSVVGTTLTFATAPANGESIEIMYFKSTTVVQPGSNTVGISELNVSDGSNGQVLTTNGSGTLSFATPSSYSDSDVESYLDGGTATPVFPSVAVSASDPVLNITRTGNWTWKVGSLANDTFAIQSNESSDASYNSIIEIDSYGHVEQGPTIKVDSSGNVGIGPGVTPAENLTIASSAPTIKFVDTDGTEQNTIVKQSGGNFFILARDNTANAGIAFGGNGNNSFDEYARFTTSGNLKFPSGQGIDFSPTANTSVTGASTTSELFDDYEEGTWTPTTNSGTITTVAGSAEYTKIGEMVFAQCRIDSFSDVTSGTHFAITGLPYPTNGTAQAHIGTGWGDFTIGYMYFYSASNNAFAYFGNAGYDAVLHSDFVSGNNILVSLIYRTG